MDGYYTVSGQEADELRDEIEQLRREIERRDRMMKRLAEAWVQAAEEALAGDPKVLRNRVEMFRAPPVDIVASEV